MPKSRSLTPLTVAFAAIATIVGVLLLSAGSAQAVSASCTAPKYPGDGYFTSMSVSSTSCSQGKKIALAHYRCRTRAGGKDGRCSRPPRTGYRCTEKRNTISTEINSRVTCKKSSAKIVFTYQQNI